MTPLPARRLEVFWWPRDWRLAVWRPKANIVRWAVQIGPIEVRRRG